MTAATRAQRAIDRAEGRGKGRVSLPVGVLAELVAEATAGAETRRELGQVVARLDRTFPGLIPTE